MAKNLEITVLYDFYGDLLTEKQQEVIELYYNEDLSLAEIAALFGNHPAGGARFDQTGRGAAHRV